MAINLAVLGNNQIMDKIVFPMDNGVGLYENGKLCVSVIDSSGNKHVDGSLIKSGPKFFELPVLRGFVYFFMGIYLYVKCIITSLALGGTAAKKEEQNRSAKKAKSFTLASGYVMLLATLLIGFLFGFLGLGMLPSYLFERAFGKFTSYYFRAFMIALIRFAIVYVILSLLRIAPFMSGLYSFNGAGSQYLAGSRIDTLRSRTYPLNFLNFLTNVFLFSTFVISLIAININFIANFAINLAIFLGLLPLIYEGLWFVTTAKATFLKDIAMLTNWLVCMKANITHEEVMKVAQIEITNYENFERAGTGRVSMSALQAEMQTKLKNSDRFDQSDLEWIIATVLGKNRAEIKLVRSLSQKESRDIMRACERRAKGEPLSSIFGFTEFYGLRFDVNRKVLSPRMETELLVEAALKKIRDLDFDRVLDLCTGSGAIAIAIAKYSNASVTATDISKQALAVAENNALKNSAKVTFIHSDLFKGLKKSRKYDIIISNPPYIKSKDIEKLDVEVKKYDPRIALDGGEDGLEFYRRIAQDAPKHLHRRGYLFFEVGQGQADVVREIMQNCGFEDIETIKDYNKIERIVYGRTCK